MAREKQKKNGHPETDHRSGGAAKKIDKTELERLHWEDNEFDSDNKSRVGEIFINLTLILLLVAGLYIMSLIAPDLFPQYTRAYVWIEQYRIYLLSGIAIFFVLLLFLSEMIHARKLAKAYKKYRDKYRDLCEDLVSVDSKEQIDAIVKERITQLIKKGVITTNLNTQKEMPSPAQPPFVQYIPGPYDAPPQFYPMQPPFNPGPVMNPMPPQPAPFVNNPNPAPPPIVTEQPAPPVIDDDTVVYGYQYFAGKTADGDTDENTSES